MAEVVITIRDDDKYKTTTDVQFSPPLTGKLTQAQAIALRFVHLYGNNVTGSTLDRVFFQTNQSQYWIHDGAVF